MTDKHDYQQNRPAPLTGVRVIDFTSVLAGPYGGTVKLTKPGPIVL